jgi:ERCC4-type nuclease
MRYHYTDKELKELLSSLTIITDSRENQNQHILDYFDKKKIPHIKQALNFADYSCMIPANPSLGIVRDMYFTDTICIERKASLDELAGNLTQDRTRFESELIRAHNCKLFLMIEDANGYSNIINHKYRSQYEPKSFLATLMAFTARYNLNINFIAAGDAGSFIYLTLLYACREQLKG